MSGRPAVLAGLLAPLLLAGCLQSEERIHVAADGTGNVRQVFTFDPRARDALLDALARLYGGEGVRLPPEAADPVAPGWFEAAARQVPGYHLSRAVRTQEGDRWVTTVEATFDDLEDAARAGTFLASAVRLERVDRETWRLLVHDGWSLLGDTTRTELGGRPLAVVREALRAALEGLALERTFVLPGEVEHTNGVLGPDRRTVTWRAGLDGLTAPEGLALEIRFRHAAADEAHLEPFHWRADPLLLARRMLEVPPGTR